ncbi:MAG: hypothetical protein PUI16_03675 [Clostridia bacterium]|nr:hypothetical protein [Clostridia bacterium]MDY5554113.1 hypothetical protein [Blautia sp.]
MDEQKQEVTKEEKQEQQEQNGFPSRTLLLWILAGIYLTYTGFSLCKNVIDKVQGAGAWVMIAGIVFLAIGLGLLFFGCRGMLRIEKKKREQALEEQPEEETEESQDKESEP